MTTLNAKSTLLNGKMKFSSSAADKEAIITDYIPPIGDGLSTTPLELFLISFATCAGGSVSGLLGKFGKKFDSLEVSAEGIRREQHPTGFEKITLTFSVVSQDMTTEELGKAIALSEEKFCPVWSMIKGNVEIETRFELKS